MDPGIIAAIIGAIATITAVVIGWWLQGKKSGTKSKGNSKEFTPDKDDIYFMQFLLHDAYQQGNPISTVELAKHHMGYAPLELEVRLITLEKRGYIKRTNNTNKGIGMWQMLPKGVEFMFSNGHQLQDLINEQRANA